MITPEIMKNASQFSVRILCLFFCLLFLTGCTGYYPGMNKHDSVSFYANLKADAFSSCGKKAAYADGRIYYLSSELGSPGIYSMDEAGDDIRLEILVEDIRAIQIQNGAIYYAGFTGLEKNAAGPYRQFRLFSQEIGATESEDFLLNATYEPYTPFENVWDFYITKEGIVAVRFIDIAGYPGRAYFFLFCFQNGVAAKISDYELVDERDEVKITSFNQSSLRLGHYMDLYAQSYVFRETTPPSSTPLEGVNSVIDLNGGKSILALAQERSDVYYNGDEYTSQGRWFCGGTADKILFASVRGVEAYDLRLNTLTGIASFSQPECVFSQIDCGDSILIFTQQLRETEFLDHIAYNVFHLNRALSESLYRVDPDTGEKEQILSTGRNQSFLYADRQTAVVGGGKTISIYDISADVPELVRTIELRHRIVDRANKVDTAGGWLFLYGFSEETQRDELLEKVYIGK